MTGRSGVHAQNRPSGSAVSTASRASCPPWARNASANLFGLKGDAVCHEASAGTQRVPTRRQDAGRRPATNEHRVRGGQLGHEPDRVPLADLNPPRGQPLGVLAGARRPFGVAFQPDRPRAGRRAAPLDGHRPGTGADVPQQFPGCRTQERERARPDVPLRDEPVVGEGVVG